MRWEVKKQEEGKWGIYLCKEFWKYPDKPVCYATSTNLSGIEQRVEWMNNGSGDVIYADVPDEDEHSFGEVDV